MKDLILQVVRFTSKLTVFYLFLFLFGSFLFYFMIKPAYTSIVNQQTFSVDAVAKAKYTPDEAVVSTGSVKEGSDITVLKKDADNDMEGATAALLEMGIPQEKISSNLSIEPKYDKDYLNIVGYKANSTLTVKTNDFTQIDGILEIVLANNFNRISGVYFTFEDPVAIRESLRAEAIETAKAKAATIASESGLRLGKLLNVTEGGYYPMNNYRVNSYAEDVMLQSEPAQSQSYNPGQTEMEMTVYLVYEVL